MTGLVDTLNGLGVPAPCVPVPCIIEASDIWEALRALLGRVGVMEGLVKLPLKFRGIFPVKFPVKLPLRFPLRFRGRFPFKFVLGPVKCLCGVGAGAGAGAMRAKE